MWCWRRRWCVEKVSIEKGGGKWVGHHRFS